MHSKNNWVRHFSSSNVMMVFIQCIYTESNVGKGVVDLSDNKKANTNRCKPDFL